MTKKQLQALISAGVFSAALLSGAAYADDANTQPTPAASAATAPEAPKAPAEIQGAPATSKPAPHKMKKHKKSMVKNMAKHGCAGKNDCKGQGGCKTGDGGCAGKNSCQGKGGCATDGSMKQQ